MRATPEVGMNVCLKSQERDAKPVVMQIEEVKGNSASCIGFTRDNMPFKIDVNLANLEKVNIARLRQVDEK